MRRKLNRSIICMLMIMLVSAPLSIAHAQESTPDTGPTQEVSLGLYPAGGQDGDRFEFTIEPGGSAEMSVQMINGGANPLRLQLFASHLVPVPNGGLQIPESGAAPEGTVSWLDFPSEEITLGAGESAERTLRVSVPEGTAPGQYVNAIALETLDPITAPGSPFEQFYRKVVSVYVTVPGDLEPSFSVGTPEIAVDGSETVITFPIENTGNVRIDLTGPVTISDSEGNILVEGSVLMGPVYMGQSTTLQMFLPGIIPSGQDYSISYELTDSGSSSSQAAQNVSIVVPESSTSASEGPLRFEEIEIAANADPIAFANVSVNINSTQQSYRSTKLTMSVYRNGEFVEDFVLAENLVIDVGVTTVTQRYIPATAWESGTYTFSLKLETTADGQTSLLHEQSEVSTIEVP